MAGVNQGYRRILVGYIQHLDFARSIYCLHRRKFTVEHNERVYNTSIFGYSQIRTQAVLYTASITCKVMDLKREGEYLCLFVCFGKPLIIASIAESAIEQELRLELTYLGLL
jgi:hypothetical protein